MPVPEPPPAPSRGWVARLREGIAPAFGASSTERRFSLWRQAAVVLAAAAFMTLTGPFGASEGPLAVRFVYWLGLLSAGTAIANLIGMAAVRMELFESRPWAWALLMAAIITPPQMVIVWAASGLVFMGRLRLAQLPTYALPVLVVTLAMLALTVLTQRTPLRTHARPPADTASDDGAGVSREDAAPPEPAFARRLPPKLRGARILAVEAEDHYLRLHTSRGEDLILMRLADAVAELEGMEGAQVHRSWWVARDAVVGARFAAGRATLTLVNGAVAPVSRTYARALREAGWY